MSSTAEQGSAAAPSEVVVNLAGLEKQYFDREPNVEEPNRLVSFGIRGRRGTSLNGTFTEAHVLAVIHAICDYRRAQSIGGSLYVGKDTHALSAAAQRTVHLLAANNLETIP